MIKKEINGALKLISKIDSFSMKFQPMLIWAEQNSFIYFYIFMPFLLMNFTVYKQSY